MHVVKEATLTVEKKYLLLFLPYLRSISLLAWTKWEKSLKKIYNCCKVQIVFKYKTRLSHNFHFKYQIPKVFNSGTVYKFQCGLCSESYLCEYVTHFNVAIPERIGTSPLTKKIKLSLRTGWQPIIYYLMN